MPAAGGKPRPGTHRDGGAAQGWVGAAGAGSDGRRVRGEYFASVDTDNEFAYRVAVFHDAVGLGDLVQLEDAVDPDRELACGN